MVHRRPWATLCLLALACGAALHGLGTWWAWRDGLWPSQGFWYAAVLALLLLASGASLAVLLRGRRPGAAELTGGIALAASLVAGLCAVLACLALYPDFRAPYAYALLGLCGSGFVLVCRAFPRLRGERLRRSLSRLLVATAAAGVALAICELLLRAWSARRPSLLLADVAVAEDRLRAFRLEPGEMWCGYPANSRGDNDDEPPARSDVERLVVVIGDSFSTPPVPRPLHYTSIAERELPGTAFYNMGAPGFDPPEYLHLLAHEALPMRPDLVVIALFVGNDLYPSRAPAVRPHPVFDRRAMLLWRASTRLWRVALANPGKGAEGSGLAGTGTPAAAPELPWIHDPLKEPPTLSRDAFLEIERSRAGSQCSAGKENLGALLAYLRDMVATAGDVPLVILLIPDEFQVEDAVWEALGPGFDRSRRTRAQDLLVPMGRAEGLVMLDLLPHMLAVPPLEDGRRHLYHLQETHWNARGNEVAGAALAAFIAERFGW